MFVFYAGLFCFCAAPENLPFDASCFIFCFMIKVFTCLKSSLALRLALYCAGDVSFVRQQQRQCFSWIIPLKLYGTSICIQSSTSYNRFVRLLTPFLNLHIQGKLISMPPCRLPSCAEAIRVGTLQYFRYFGPSSSAAATVARPHHCGRRR